MSALEDIKQMQEQGIGEDEIIQKMRESGYSPREIDDALNQSKIKAAIYDGAEQEMQPSVMTEQETQPPEQGTQVSEYAYQTPQAAQPGYEYYPQQAETSQELITEIAEQVVAEKVSEIKKNLGSMAEFKTIAEAKISDIDLRLKRIETTIEKLQFAILGKIGDYGQSVQDIKGEMQMMQESFSKLVNPFISKTRERKSQVVEDESQETEAKEAEASEKNETEEKEEEKPRRKAKEKQSFEDYLR